ncbi:heparan-alpha-glucosaminide N-acetyltransferase domain-containing protein [Bacteroidota bacterium]
MIPKNRIASIDILRALTMYFMIFVNDLWTLEGIPEWLGHASRGEDRLGFADIIFPLFLFIVGLSIPFAMKARRKKGDSDLQIFGHIIRRSLALVAMGFFMVNLENINRELLTVSKPVWQFLMATSFVMIWNIYPDGKAFKKIPEWVMQVLGIIILVILAFLYKGGSVENPHWLRPHWWGILGLIGWAYFLIATIYLLTANRLGWIIVIWFVLILLNIQEHITLFDGFPKIKIIVNASNYAMVMSGLLASVIYVRFNEKNKIKEFLAVMAILAVIVIAFALLTRPEWGIKKMGGTPSWVAICSGIGFASLGILYILADILNIRKWANIIGPAGRSTLTCYLVPYFYYSIYSIIGYQLPEILRTGYIGIVKSLLFALLIVTITGGLERIKIKLKI